MKRSVVSQRKSNIEFLRIISMIMIVAHHLAVHSCFIFQTDSITVNRLWCQLLQIGGKIGVNVFVLISGYFLSQSSSVKIKKVFRLWLQIFTYSIVPYLVLVMVGIESFSGKEILKSFFPLTFSNWWFASVYFVLYLIFPYINKLLKSLEKKEHQKLLGLLFVLWCIIPTFSTQSYQSNELLWFVFLYILAGYIYLYFDSKYIKGSTCLLISCVLILLTFLSAVVFDILGVKVPIFAEHATYFYGMQKLPVLLISVMMVIGFINIKIEFSRIINIVSSATFGVYLIHDNKFIRKLIWQTIFQNKLFADKDVLIPYTIIQIVIVFILCTLIELFRINILEKSYLKVIDNVTSLIEELSRKIKSQFSNWQEKSLL